MSTDQNAESDFMERVAHEFRSLTERAYKISADAGSIVETVLMAGLREPLSPEEARDLLGKVVRALRDGMTKRGDLGAAARTDAELDDFVARTVSARERLADTQPARVDLVEWNGIAPRAVRPVPTFHGREVPVREGFVRTADIDLWGDNARLDIHLAQFQRKHNRVPNADELLQIMLSKMDLPGIEDDQFEIPSLARSIAVNGVRKPPIIDLDGTLLDGNRRVAACYYILHSADAEFDTAAKRRAERIVVWQLTEHATDEDREAVIVSLNFESDQKQEWPKYVRAKKVYAEWQASLAREPRAAAARQRELKRELAKKFAFTDTQQVSLFIKMVEVANEFEEHHILENKKDPFEVKHRAERYFEYFDELSKGAAGGVSFMLNNNPSLKQLVYDLVYDGKFSNWNKIRDLRHIAANEEAMAHLRRAKSEEDTTLGQEIVDEAIGIAKTKSAATRQLGANTRIETFVKWLEDLPVKAFRDQIKPDNLRKLHAALVLVQGHVATLETEGWDDPGADAQV